MTTIKSHFIKMTSTYGKLFLCIISFFTIAFIVYLGYSKSTLLDSQREIKESYAEHIRKADSLYLNLMNYNKSMTDNILSLNSGLLTDSLIKSTLAGKNKLSRKQYNALSSLILNHSKVLEHSQKLYESKIQRDSLRLGVESDLLNGQTKTMLDLHLNKIEHEYSNITMWAAILTILFLVFSFYSIFKMDELIQQGNEGVKDIRHLKRNGEQEVEKLRDTTKKLKDSTREDIDSFILSQQNRMKESFETIINHKNKIEQINSDALSNFNELKKKLDGDFQRISKEYEEQIKQLLNEKNKQFQDINERMNNLIIQTSTYINTLESNNRFASNNTESNNNTELDNNAETNGKEEQK